MVARPEGLLHTVILARRRRRRARWVLTGAESDSHLFFTSHHRHRYTHWQMSTRPAVASRPYSSPRHFGELWNEALRRYEKETGNRLLDLPIAQAFPSQPGNAEVVMEHFNKQIEAFETFRDRGKKIWSVLRRIVDVVLLIRDCAGGASVSRSGRAFSISEDDCLTPKQGAVPSGGVMFGAIAVLLQVTLPLRSSSSPSPLILRRPRRESIDCIMPSSLSSTKPRIISSAPRFTWNHGCHQVLH